jgi:protocatechuate 3,4-dioxygenase beta subunit
MTKITSLLGFAALLAWPFVTAHPGEQHDAAQVKRDIVVRDMRARHARRSLNRCEGSVDHQALVRKSIKRRSEQLEKLRQARGITASSKYNIPVRCRASSRNLTFDEASRKFRRDATSFAAFEATNHNQTGILNYTSSIDASTIFSANTSCILAPDVTSGPYYVQGELIRQDVKEDLDSSGIDLFVEMQWLDVETCQPISNIAVDLWSANATGVYSGVTASGNSPVGGYNSTFLRGVQITDDDGVVAFDTIVPGHYSGRATHTHILGHMNVTVFSNGTYSRNTGSVTHIGQLFYPETLRAAVEAVEPYASNTQTETSNAQDSIGAAQADNNYDPFPQFVYVGNDISDGIFAWIQIGVNASVDLTNAGDYSVAAYHGEDGGEVNSNSMFGDGNGGPPGGDSLNGTTPSGSRPSSSVNGTMPVANSVSTVTSTDSSSFSASNSASTITASAAAASSVTVSTGAGPRVSDVLGGSTLRKAFYATWTIALLFRI